MAHGCDRSCAGGAVASSICDATMQCYHQTVLGVARSVVANGLSIGTVFRVEEEADKIGPVMCGWACSSRAEGVLANE